jgi:hypothetical protein
MNTRCRILSALLFVAMTAVGLHAQTLEVINAQGLSIIITAAQIASLPHIVLKVSDHDTPATFDGVPLSNVLSLARIPLGDTLSGPRLTEVAVRQCV